MECPRGSYCTELEHDVKTYKKASEWLPGVFHADLPIKIRRMRASNGRTMVEIYNCNGELINKRG